MTNAGGEAPTATRSLLARRFLADRNGRCRHLAADPLLVARAQHAGLAEQRTHRVGGQRAVVEPVVGPIVFEIERRLALAGSVLPDDLDELAVARAARVGDDN